MPGKEGFDLEAFRAQEPTEEEMKTFDVHLGTSKDDEGNPIEDVIKFPNIKRWPMKVQTMFGKGEIIEGIQLLAGEDSARLFDAYDWTIGEFQALFDALSKWSGFQMGTISAPQPPQGRTPKQN